MKKDKKSMKIDVKEILKSNPHIDKGQFEIIQKQTNELKALGFKRTKYSLAIPFMRRLRIKQKFAA